MILDSRSEFCNATSVVLTQGASWQNIGDVYDRQAVSGFSAAPGNVTVDLGKGQPIYLVIRVTTGVIAAGNGSIAFRLVSDTSDNPPNASSATIHWTSASYSTTTANPSATLPAGTLVVAMALPMSSYERYLGVQALVSTQNTTAGAIDAFLTLDYSAVRHYVNAIDSTT
jgi:hypothetical protein